MRPDTATRRSHPWSLPVRALLPALGLGLALLAGCSVNPATGERQLTLISESREIQMGRQSDEEVVESLGLYPDEDLQAYVDRIGRDLAAVSERPDLPWTFRVVDDPVVNAFALPGGFIYVTRGILAHLNSEAELAGVLGHEIGHVTGRHAVERLSKAQLAQIGLGVGMAVSEDVARFGDLAQQGLGVLFLKFSRDDERQSDDLGLRYMIRAGYDPREMPDVFETLRRVSEAQGAGRIPGWLSTHPAPENRIERIDERLPETVSPDAVVARERYLHRLEGLEYGTDPREGFFEDSIFYHPELEFRLDFPDGWNTRNRKDSVAAASPDQDAVVVLSLTGESDVHGAAREFYRRTGADRNRELALSVGGLPSVADEFVAQTRRGSVAGIAAFIEYGGRVYRLLGYGSAERYPGRAREMRDAIESFGPVRDPRVLEVEPRRLEIVETPRAMTLAELAERTPSTVDVETLAVLNAMTPETRLEAGRPVKRVVGGNLPD